MAITHVNDQPNILFIMTDQQRFDTINAVGNGGIYTPNLDRLVARGITFTNAYSTCPVCIPARYTVITGCEPPTTAVWKNMYYPEMHNKIERNCGTYLPAEMRKLGYQTFGVGKFHTIPLDASVGFDTQLLCEDNPADDYRKYLRETHPEYTWIEGPTGERTEMFYMPQRCPLPANITPEAWTTDCAIELISSASDSPWFGFVSFLAPHPPFAPPQPFNRIYDPDRMRSPMCGEIDIDHMDQRIPLMNRFTWSENVSEDRARILKSRYYGCVTYVDYCLGRILDAVEEQGDADNTLICFFSDHGEHLGDHHAWQKESFFEASTRIPFLLSWPHRVPVETKSDLICLTDLFGIATSAAGKVDIREGVDVMATLTSYHPGREVLFGYHGMPGTNEFKLMVRKDRWKLIFFANGGLTQLFDTESDPNELHELSNDFPSLVLHLKKLAAYELERRGCTEALDGTELLELHFESWKKRVRTERDKNTSGSIDRIYQFDSSSGVNCFPRHPSEILCEYKE